MSLILADYGKTFRNGPTDINEDGTVDGIDIGELLSDWGELEPNVLWYDDWYEKPDVGGNSGDKDPDKGGINGRRI